MDRIAFRHERKEAAEAVRPLLPKGLDRASVEFVAGLLMRWDQDLSTAAQKLKNKLPSLHLSDDLLSKVHARARSASIVARTELPDVLPDLKKGDGWCRDHFSFAKTAVPYERRKMMEGIVAFRGFDDVRASGIIIEIAPGKEGLIRELAGAVAADGSCPLLDVLKNEGTLKVQVGNKKIPGITKTSLSTHDLFDHLFLYGVMKKEGILNRYRVLLDSLGAPDKVNLFSREGEIPASIAYDWRSWRAEETPPRTDFNPPSHLIERLSRPNATANQERAAGILRSLDPKDPVGPLISYIYTNLLAERSENGRRFGEAYSIGKHGQYKYFAHTDPEILAMVVETVVALEKPKHRAEEVLLNINLHLEDFLMRSARGEKAVLHANEELFQNPPADTIVPESRQRFLAKHLGCNAVRTKGICDTAD